MEIIQDISALRIRIKDARWQRKLVGFVPTMGWLHQGHLALLERARAENDLTILSIFVNPIQFGVGEDYQEYPRDFESDAAKVEKAGGHIIFAPTAQEMYPRGYATFVEVERLTAGLCGLSRPDHFRGITTVVTKLFNIVTPDQAYFGQKDAQQALVIQRMVKDLNMDIKVNVMPTVREEDGLAMSSRNSYLSPAERAAAPVIFQTLAQVSEKIQGGQRDAASIHAFIINKISAEPLAVIDYVALVDAEEIKPVKEISGRTLIAVAVRFGKTRLIDNMIVEV